MAKTVKVKRSEVTLLDKQGNEVDSEELAFGVEYAIIGHDSAVTYKFGENENHDRMYAGFGFKTLATNEASQVRQKDSKANAAEQMTAVAERHTLVGTGIWVDRSREGVTRLMDKDVLAPIVVTGFVARGKPVELAKVRERLDSDPAWYADLQRNPEIIAAYREAMGKPAKSMDELLGDM